MISRLRFPTFKLGVSARSLVACGVIAAAAGLVGGPALALLAMLACYLATPLVTVLSRVVRVGGLG